MATLKSATNARIVPAQLSFLSIYNPAFGQTDEAAYDQIFYYFSKEDANFQKQDYTKTGKGKENIEAKSTDDVKNDRLRQVGLARGMVEFANNFSNGVPVDTIETEKSRIVLRELEPNWWILASIDVTRLPTAVKEAHKDAKNANTAGQTIEYSAREVAPSQLLLTQLQQAHSIFLLHHATSLTELLQRLGRDLFTDMLERFWNRFAWDWDVLLHGNPATDIYNSVKLAGGGELGIGVGEEEWGSGEREVLEDFVHRTEGLVDVIVGRYGDPPQEASAKTKEVENPPLKPWLGLENDPRAADGILFSGVGSLSRRSLATVSQWMDAIFKHGEHAYGVGDNPSSRPRHRRKRRKLDAATGDEELHRSRPVKQEEAHPRVKSPRAKPPDYRRKAIENAATPPGIPPPLVSSVERSLDSALKKIEQRTNSQSPTKEKTREEAFGSEEQDQAYFDSEKMMSYLKLGYGSSWTLSPKGFQKDDASRKSNADQPSSSLSNQEELRPDLQEVDPTPEVSDDEAEKEKSFVQHLEQSIGRFLIGLSGDLENTEFEDELPDSVESSTNNQISPKRIHMRTLTVHMSEEHTWNNRQPDSPTHVFRRYSSFSSSRSADANEPKTSAAASIDGPSPNEVYEKVRVVVYVHQPFIFTFLFDLQTPTLTMPAFYRRIHHQLGPLQKPLLRSTDPARIPERVLQLIGEKAGNLESQSSGLYDLVYDPSKLTVRTSIPNIPLPGTLAAEGILSAQNPAPTSSRTVSGAWYTLGIPVGSISGSSHSTTNSQDGNALVQTEWTRLEALNVHTQILNIWASMRAPGTIKLNPTGDLEQTVKTARGWWVVWMRLPPLLPHTPGGNSRPGSSATMRHWKESLSGSGAREAFLVRKSVDAGARAKEANAKSASSGRWLLRDQTRDVSGSTAASQAAAATSARGVIEGVGVDARRWVEGLSKLSQ